MCLKHRIALKHSIHNQLCFFSTLWHVDMFDLWMSMLHRSWKSERLTIKEQSLVCSLKFQTIRSSKMLGVYTIICRARLALLSAFADRLLLWKVSGILVSVKKTLNIVYIFLWYTLYKSYQHCLLKNAYIAIV